MVWLCAIGAWLSVAGTRPAPLRDEDAQHLLRTAAAVGLAAPCRRERHDDDHQLVGEYRNPEEHAAAGNVGEKIGFHRDIPSVRVLRADGAVAPSQVNGLDMIFDPLRPVVGFWSWVDPATCPIVVVNHCRARLGVGLRSLYGMRRSARPAVALGRVAEPRVTRMGTVRP